MADAICLPKRIVLSRKGWDSSSGGRPSPILEDGTLLSLPIPDCGSRIRFGDLRWPDGRAGLSSLVRNLSNNLWTEESELHLDPDLRKNAIKREGGFQPAFGQCGNAQSHLQNKCVEEGDLFLFFGLFRQVEQEKGNWRYVPRTPNLHVISGWLQVGKRLPLRAEEVPDNLKRHPHAILSFRVKGKRNNTIYLPRKKLTFSELAGAGLFEAPFCAKKGDPRRLSKPDQGQATKWQLPRFFFGLSNMPEDPRDLTKEFWEPQRKGPGQEFVLDVSGKAPEARKWLNVLFGKARCPAEFSQ